MTVFRPHARHAEGYIQAVRSLASDLIRWRWHISTSFASDFRAAYAGTLLGRFWNIIMPLTPIGAYSLLLLLLRPSMRGDVNAVVFVTIGVTFWFLYADIIQSIMNAVESKRSAIAKTTFPMIGVVAAEFGRLSFEFLIRFLAVLIIFVIFQGAPSPWVLLAPLVLLMGLLFFLGLGLIASVLNAVLTDTGSVIALLLRYGIFFSNVIFPLNLTGALAWFELLNPFAFFIDAIRDLAVAGQLPDPAALTAYAVVSLAVFLLGCRLFYVMEPELRSF